MHFLQRKIKNGYIIRSYIKLIQFRILVTVIVSFLVLFFVSEERKINCIQNERDNLVIGNLDALSPSLKLSEKSVEGIFMIKDPMLFSIIEQTPSLEHNIIFDSFNPEAEIQQKIKQLLA